jgi:hypothetical protein
MSFGGNITLSMRAVPRRQESVSDPRVGSGYERRRLSAYKSDWLLQAGDIIASQLVQPSHKPDWNSWVTIELRLITVVRVPR